jgi:hypothetical protein
MCLPTTISTTTTTTPVATGRADFGLDLLSSCLRPTALDLISLPETLALPSPAPFLAKPHTSLCQPPSYQAELVELRSLVEGLTRKNRYLAEELAELNRSQDTAHTQLLGLQVRRCVDTGNTIRECQAISSKQ